MPTTGFPCLGNLQLRRKELGAASGPAEHHLHPIVAPINDLNDTYVNFDGITYAKGASVLEAARVLRGP